MSKKWSIFLVIVLVAGLVLPACGDEEKDDTEEIKTVKVAISAPLGLDIGQDVVNVAQMALDENGGKAGKLKVELLPLDVSDPNGSPVSVDFEKQAAEKAAKDKSVVAYLGPMTSDQAKVSVPILSAASIVQVTESATWPGLTKPGFGAGEPGTYYPSGQRTFFRVLPSDDVQGLAGAKWANSLGVKKAYVIDDGTSYGIGLSGIFEAAATDYEIEIIDHVSLAADATEDDLAALAETVAAAEPDLVYFGGGVVPHGVGMVRALRTANPTLVIMGTDGLQQDEFVAELGAELAEGVYVTGLTIPATEQKNAEAFVAAYTEKYGKEPAPYVILAYEGMKVILAAIEKAGSADRGKVLDAMTNLGVYTGVLGLWSFDEYGDIKDAPISGWQIQSGVWTYVKLIE
ncbi:MAG TPA: branched-chain amino acid ABC transporter substrate-binding protein [Aggregatilineaceae bacterium]|nr:branched-chain amino acid ABC transporter substrate-binding protein [Aggregatilineaceae bacterium]